MKNFVANGESLQVTAGAGGVTGGSVKAVGQVVGVVVADAAEGELYTLKVTGVYYPVPKAAGEAWSKCDKLYLKADGTALTKTDTNNIFAGYAYEAALSADVVGAILLSH